MVVNNTSIRPAISLENTWIFGGFTLKDWWNIHSTKCYFLISQAFFTFSSYVNWKQRSICGGLQYEVVLKPQKTRPQPEKFIQVGVLGLLGRHHFSFPPKKARNNYENFCAFSIGNRSWTVAVLQWCCVRFPRDNTSTWRSVWTGTAMSDFRDFVYFWGSSFVSPWV